MKVRRRAGAPVALALILFYSALSALGAARSAGDRVKTDAGVVEGTVSGDVLSFKGIPYTFDTLAARYGKDVTEKDRATARAFHSYFANFAKTGDPNGGGLPNWPRYDPAKSDLMHITPDDGPVTGADPWGERLDLIARAADAQTSTREAAGLGGTSWQLVKFQGGDDRVLVPDDGSKYTITFGSDGRVAARLDCNRGSGTWKSEGPNGLRFGPLALTRAMCREPTLHDRLARDWTAVRSYVMKDGNLFLSLMADGGIYEFAPAGGGQPPATTEGRVTGTVRYLQRIALPPGAVVEVKLVDVSRADAPAVTIAEQVIKPAGRQVPVAFELRYDPRRIEENRRYAVRARILVGGRPRFASTDAYPVITGGHTDTADVIVRPARR